LLCSSSCPRVVIAGTHSGVGKTSVSIAITALFKKHGLRVQTFKVGPDFLDPTYLTAASGRPCYNLDTWMFGKEYTKELFVRATEDADIAIIEGVMGLYDGADPVLPDGSTFEVANLLHAPVILIADAKGISRSFAAMVKGYVEFDNFTCAGVIANNCGSERHVELLRESVSAASSLPPLLGGIPKGTFGQLRSRHLGLISAEWEKTEVFRSMADALEQHISVDKLMSRLRGIQPLQIEITSEMRQTTHIRLGLAYDKAFHFYYNDNVAALERMGCEIVRFSPINGSFPEKLDGLYIGGGYPEEHAQALSENTVMLQNIQSFASGGGLIYAECGGLLYLTEGLKTIDEKQYNMVGLLPVLSRMRKRFKSLGYVEVEFEKDSLFGRRGEKIRGHTFHYSELASNPTENSEWCNAYRLNRRRTKNTEKEGFQKGRILATYVHTHFASNKEAMHNFINSCKEKQ